MRERRKMAGGERGLEARRKDGDKYDEGEQDGEQDGERDVKISTGIMAMAMADLVIKRVSASIFV